MFSLNIGILTTVILCVTGSNKEYPSISKSCRLGDSAENECNRCICTLKGFFECQPKPCNKTSVDINKEELSCHPNRVYERNLTVCICNKNGVWPHEKCKTTFSSFPITKQECKPNSYVIIDCNVCKCGSDGILDKSHCTKNKCSVITLASKGRRFIKQNQVYGSCEAKNWYSLAPCQFCFCISENKLVCNTGNNYAKKLRLGSYNLSICGIDLIKDAIALIPDRKSALRFGNELHNKTNASDSGIALKTPIVKSEEDSSLTSIELNRENSKKNNDEQRKKKESEEYYSDSDEAKPIDIAREGLSTQLPMPYEDEENDVSEDIKNRSGESQKDGNFPKDIQRLKVIDVKPNPEKNFTFDNFPEQFEWKSPEVGTKSLRELATEGFNLGDVLKPYIPVVLDKVFQLALRKSMVSVDAHADCTPGTTTVFKCNACFCMKNNKLLCTNNTCT